MTYCTVKGCHNSSHNHQKHLKIPFHAFPSDPLVAAQWIEKIRLNRKDSLWKPTKYTKICSIHFDEKEKYRTKSGLCKLREGAIPKKGLHIYCTEETHNSNDDPHDTQELDNPDLSPSPVENSYFNTLSISSCEQKPTIYDNESLASNISQKSDTDLDSIYDTPQESALRKKLRKKISLERKHNKKIKALHQTVRRLKKKNASLQKKIINLQKKRFIDNND